VCLSTTNCKQRAARFAPKSLSLLLGFIANSFVPRDEASLILSDASNTTKAALFAYFFATEFASKILSLGILFQKVYQECSHK